MKQPTKSALVCSPGPWESKLGSRGGLPSCVVDAKGFPILEAPRKYDDPSLKDHELGNLALAAASPDMLEACRLSLLMTDHAEGCAWQRANISEMQTKEQRRALWLRCDCHKATARTAIIKATGVDPVAEE